jgi:rhamnose transport system permease protein
MTTVTTPRRRLSIRGAARELSVVGALVVIVVVTTLITPSFLNAQGVVNLLANCTLYIVLALGQSLVVLTRNIDLSVGSIVGLTAYGTGVTFAALPGIPIVLVFVIGAVFGAVLGAVNGLIVAIAKVPSLVVTLGTLYIYRGLANLWAGSNQYFAGSRPDAFGELSTSTFFGLPYITLGAIVLVIIVGVYTLRVRSGRDLYAIGSDPDAAVLFGIPVAKRIVWAFAWCGALTGLAGVSYASACNAVAATTGTGYELQVVAAVVVGGVAIFGGSGTAVGASLGAILLITINGALPAVGISKFWQQAIVGVLIVAAIMTDRILTVVRARRLRTTEAEHD